MTATTPPPDAPFGPDTDEAVSALVDGELAAFATDHGLSEADARARLDAWPDLAARRAVLEDARASIAAPVPALDDVSRRRLVRGALGERALIASDAPVPRSRRTVWTVVGAVAASLLVVVGIALALDASGGGGDDSASSSGGSAVKLPELHGDLGDIGDVSTPAALRALLEGTSAAPAEGRTEDASPSAPAAGGSDRNLAASPERCAAQLAGDRDVTFVASGTFRGRSVTIIGLTENARTIAFVVPSDDCTDILTSISR